MLKFTQLFIGFSMACTLAHAQWTSNVNINTVVKDSVGFEEATPLSATTTDGKTFISYFAQYGGSYQLRMQLLDSAGNKLFGTSGLLVSNQPQSSALYRYDMQVDENDNAVVAFQDIRTNGSLHVVVYKIDQAGNLLWGSNGIQLIDPVSVQGLAPTIGFTHTGNVIVGWVASSAGNYKWVGYQKISSAGVVLWNTNLRVTDSTFTHKYSRQTFVPAGPDDFIMLYAEETGPGLAPSKMYAQRFDINGSKVWTSAKLVSTYTIPFFYFCRAVADLNDGFYVAFNTGNINFPAQGDVYLQHVDGNGNSWNATGNVVCALGNAQKFCATMRFDPANNNAWVLLKTTDIGQSLSGVAVQKVDSAGNNLLGANGIQLVPILGYDDPADFCITTDGVISFYKSGINQSQTLHAIKNDLTGALQWGGNPVDICIYSAGKDDLSAGLYTGTNVIAVWDDNRNDYGVYAQNITNTGLTGSASSLTQIDKKEFTITASPNPCIDKLFVESTNGQTHKPFNLKIYSPLGLIFEGMIDHRIEIDTHTWPSGIYFIDAGSVARKVIKM